MSIWLEPLLLAAAPMTTTTRSAVAPAASTYAWAIAQTLALLAAGLAIYFATYGRRRQTWAPPRVDAAGAPGPLWVIASAMVWCFLAPLAIFAAGRGVAARPLGDGTHVLIYGGTCLAGLAIAAGLHALMRRANTVRALGVVPLRATVLPGRAAVAAAIALPLAYFVAALSQLAWQLLGLKHEPAHAMLQLMERNVASPWVVWVTIANAAVLAPTFEEVLFRGHLQTAIGAALPRWRWPAIVITSLVFALIHDAWTMPAIFALSIAIGVAYEWTGSLWVAIAIHVAFNTTSTAMFLLSR